MSQQRRNRMLKFRITEISAVRKPAQEGALIGIAKSADDIVIAKAATPLMHCGVAVDGEYCGECGAKVSAKQDSDVVCKGCGSELSKKFCTKCGMAKAQPLDNPSPTEHTMTDQEKAEKAALEAQVAKLQKLAALTDAEKSFYSRLNLDGQSAFLAKSATERAEEMKPVYTADDGTVFTKADDSKMVDLAKRADSDRKRLELEIAKSQEAVFKARAADELKHLPGDEAVKVALIKMSEQINDEKLREGVKSALKAHNEQLAKSFERSGVGSTVVPSTAEAKLDALVEKTATEKKIPIAKAWDEVLATAEGQKIYAEIEAAKRPSVH